MALNCYLYRMFNGYPFFFFHLAKEFPTFSLNTQWVFLLCSVVGWTQRALLFKSILVTLGSYPRIHKRLSLLTQQVKHSLNKFNETKENRLSEIMQQKLLAAKSNINTCDLLHNQHKMLTILKSLFKYSYRLNYYGGHKLIFRKCLIFLFWRKHLSASPQSRTSHKGGFLLFICFKCDPGEQVGGKGKVNRKDQSPDTKMLYLMGSHFGPVGVHSLRSLRNLINVTQNCPAWDRRATIHPPIFPGVQGGPGGDVSPHSSRAS